MNVEKFCSTPQYIKWRNELRVQKSILKNLDKSNVAAILITEAKIAELKRLMRI